MDPSSSLPLPTFARSAAGTPSDAAPPRGELVTVTRVFNSLEAEMLRGCLESEGIPVTLGDAQTVQTELTVALGGIRVMVPVAFAAAARLTVEAVERGALEIDELPADAQAAASEDDDDGAAVRPWLSRGGWIVLGVVILAIAVF